MRSYHAAPMPIAIASARPPAIVRPGYLSEHPEPELHVQPRHADAHGASLALDAPDVPTVSALAEPRAHGIEPRRHREPQRAEATVGALLPRAPI